MRRKQEVYFSLSFPQTDPEKRIQVQLLYLGVQLSRLLLWTLKRLWNMSENSPPKDEEVRICPPSPSPSLVEGRSWGLTLRKSSQKSPVVRELVYK